MTNERRVDVEVESRAAEGYGGDVTPKQAWRVLSQDPAAQLVDVRSAAEWTFVGVPDLSSVDKAAIFVEWQRYPGMARVAEFEEDTLAALKAASAKTTAPVFFLCRSGGRSMAAARALTALGHTAAFNIIGGFEGDLDEGRHRATLSGWKHDQLPWIQK